MACAPKEAYLIPISQLTTAEPEEGVLAQLLQRQPELRRLPALLAAYLELDEAADLMQQLREKLFRSQVSQPAKEAAHVCTCRAPSVHLHDGCLWDLCIS